MKAIAARRARVARVRRAQHLLAAAEAASAQHKLEQLETNAAKLAALRDSLSLESGETTGAILHNRGELAARLDKVRDGLKDAIVGAHATARERAGQRLDARQKQESAEKLDNRAAQSLGAWLEARRAVPFRRKTKPYDLENG
jgi:porphobilinogen deaminase